ncbi:MAG TPA: M28 family peptidase [Tenuifilaceae bacterium]|nr:M28 family peptidase [Tenuifilaceae bacterium]
MEPAVNPSKKIANNSLFQLAIVAVTFLIAATSVWLTSPPEPKSINTPSNEFSAARAFIHTEAIAQKPHMIGTDENKRVANYLAEQLNRIGLEVDTQKTTALNFEDVPIYGRVTNVVGRLKGTASTKAVLVLGHYDSQPYSLGAADDGIALASMLEAAEVLKNNYSLQNDIIFLFTDAEEVGLLGAIAFAKEHPWVNEVGLVLNVEARGTRGPALSFEVSPENGWIMREFIKHVERPYAGSMMYEVYKMMPNYTDFTIFKNKGLSGFNVAIIEGYENYHSPTDKPENLSLASLQHMGSYIMSIAKHFGNISLENTKEKDLVYFNILGSKMIYYPMSWNTIFLIIIILLFVFYIFLGFTRTQLSTWKIIGSFFLIIFTIALTVGSVWLVNGWIKNLYPHYNVFYMSNYHNARFYFYAYMALVVAVSTLVFYLLFKRINIYNLMAAVFILFIIMSAFIYFKIPTASYFTYLPLLFGLLAFNLLLWFDLNPSKNPGSYYLALFFGATPFVLVISSFTFLLYHIFGLKMPFAGAALQTLIMLVIMPLFDVALKRFKLGIPFVAFLISVAYLVVAHVNSGYTEKYPLQSNVMYASLLDQQKAYWLSSFTKTDEWNQQFFPNSVVDSIPDIYPGRSRMYLKNEADFMEFARPLAAVTTDSVFQNNRYLEFNLKSMIHSGGFEIVIPTSYELKSFAVDSVEAYGIERMANSKQGYVFRCFNPGEEGFNVSLHYAGVDSLEFSVIEKRLGLPPFSYIKPMPENIIKGVGYESHITLVKSSLKL